MNVLQTFRSCLLDEPKPLLHTHTRKSASRPYIQLVLKQHLWYTRHHSSHLKLLVGGELRQQHGLPWWSNG